MLASVLARTRAIIRNYRWQWLDPSHNEEDIPIPLLIGPLRYDVVVLRDFVRFYLARRDLAADNFWRFLDEARRHRFHDWKFASHAVREPHTTRDPALWAKEFAAEVRQAIDVWESIREGFDLRFPIEVRVTSRLLPAISGKRVRARYILGDGSHRLACLMVLGHTALPRDCYRIRWYRRLRPNDSTWLLTRRGALPPQEYFAFLSMVYGAPQPFSDRAGFTGYTERHMPDRLDEIRQVVRVDGFGA